MRRSLSDRFPTVTRLLASAGFVDSETPKPEDVDGDTDGEGEDTDEGLDDEGIEQPKPADTDEEQADQTTSPPAAPTASAPASAALMAGFEKDADALVLAEQTRCITVFTSTEGRRNPDAAAELLAEEMSSERIISVLGKASGSLRGAGRERLNASTTVKPVTGGATDPAAGTVDAVKAEQKAKRDKRNASLQAKGGVKVDSDATR